MRPVLVTRNRAATAAGWGLYSLTCRLRPSLKASISFERLGGYPWGRRPPEPADQEVYPTWVARTRRGARPPPARQTALDFSRAAITMTGAMASVVLEDVSKSFCGPGKRVIEALKHVQLSANSGELLVLVGPSGSGKTTLLRLIAGLENPTRGSIRIGGQLMDNVAAKDRGLAMVFQNYALFPHLTIFENLALGLRLRRVARDEIDRRVLDAATALELTPLLDCRPATLSGGQSQRVALGRALVRQPRVFLLDEPLASLDPPLRAQLRAEIRQLHDRLKTTMIYVTHDQTEALALADRVAVLHAGEVEQIGEPMTLYRHPATRFVAGFIGLPRMNMIDGRLICHDSAVCFEPQMLSGTGGHTNRPGLWRLPPEHCDRLQSFIGQRVTVGIRPEDIALAPSGTKPDGEPDMDATIAAVEPLGASVDVHLRCGPLVLISRIPAGESLAVNQAVPLILNHTQAHYFEEKSGKAL